MTPTALKNPLFIRSHSTSEQQLKAFLEVVKADAGLQEKLKAAADADVLVAIAKTAGFVISAEELKRAQVELSDAELEDVGGGRGWTVTILWGNCGCLTSNN